MNQILQPGQTIRSESGMDCRVEKLLGAGGQGEVYLARLADQPCALKWYFPHTATQQQRDGLETLVKKGPPNDRFLWPVDLTWTPGVEGFGYIMKLRDERYKGVVDLMMRRVNPTFRALSTSGYELANSFLQLHAKGLCYRDISFGNVFFDPDNGSVLICDNDNVTVDNNPVATILGTPRFMAPEVVRGEALPSTRTDLFSLAVLLFYMLVRHHPLEGKKEADIHSFDAPAMTKLYGTEPIFIWDPIDDSNRAVPGYQDNAVIFWEIYPQFLKELFTRAFTDGIRVPDSRVRESEWRAALIRLRDSIVYCSNCGAQNFYDAEALKAPNGQPKPCWKCKRPFQLPARIRIGKSIVMLNHDTKLYPHHLDDQRRYDFEQPVAEMVQHPTNPMVWGIKNLSADNWVVTTAGGDVNDVPPGRSVSLAVGTKIQFGRSEGEIRVLQT